MGLMFISRFTLHEVVRRRLFLAILILSIILVVLFAVLLNLVVSQARTSFQGGDPENWRRQLVTAGVVMSIITGWLVYVISSILTIMMSIGMISSEMEAGTFSVIVPKPLRRMEIVLGKWLAYALILSIYTILLFLAFEGIIYWLTGYWPADWLTALGMLIMAMLTLLAITTLGSTVFPTLANGAIALILYIGAPIANFIQYVAKLLQPQNNDAFQNIATTISLLIPTDALWRGASYYLLPNIFGLAGDTINTPFTSGSAPSTLFLIWAVCYIVLLPLLAVWRFQRRDL